MLFKRPGGLVPPPWGDPGGVPGGSAVKWVPGGAGAVRNHVKLSFLSTALDPQAGVMLSQHSFSFWDRFSFWLDSADFLNPRVLSGFSNS